MLGRLPWKITPGSLTLPALAFFSVILPRSLSNCDGAVAKAPPRVQALAREDNRRYDGTV